MEVWRKVKFKATFAFWALIVILCLAAFLRLYQLDSIPPGLTWDEAALGYNAYSLLKTGKDEYGNFLPLTLKSFGDYKPALYAYVVIPFIAILGLNELAVRLPSAFSGLGIVLLIYLLVFQLWQKQKLALAAAFMGAISPLAIQFSRAAFESNMAVFLNLLGSWLLIKAVVGKRFLFFALASLSFLASMWSYQASRLFTPLLFFSLIIILWSKLIKDKLFYAVFCLTVFGFILTYASVFIGGKSNRLAVMSLFSYRRSDETIALIAREDGTSPDSFSFQLVHGEWLAYIKGVAERYLMYFSPKMLFIEGDYNQRHRVPDLGTLYYFSLILLSLGLYNLLRSERIPKWVILSWWLLAPLPAALSRDLISMIRGLNLLIPFTVLEGLGLYTLWQLTGRLVDLGKNFSRLIVIFVIVSNLIVFLDRYFVHLSPEYSQYWLYGYKQVVDILKRLEAEKRYDRIVFTDKYGQPYVYYLFYTQYPPVNFQIQSRLDQPGLDTGTVRKIDNIEFRPISWPEDRFLPNSLFIAAPIEIPDQDIVPNQARVLGEVKFLNGETAFKIVETGPPSLARN